MALTWARMVPVVTVVAVAWGCAGREEARRAALLLANATDSYVKEVSAKIVSEQRFYAQARENFERQLRNEEEKRVAWEANQPSFESLDLVEQLVRDEQKFRIPGDFFAVLL